VSELRTLTNVEPASQSDPLLESARLWQRERRVLSVTTVVKRETGGSQSRLVLCDDKKLYVLKMHPSPQGPNVLANEALGSILMRGLGFRVPRWRAVTINLKVLRIFPELEMETPCGPTFPACGIHFASEFLGGPGEVLYNFIPESFIPRLDDHAQLLAVYLFDIWASHQDERQCIFRRNRRTGLYEAFFIDNGHLFGGPSWLEIAGRPRSCSSYLRPPMIGDLIEAYIALFEHRIPTLLHHAIGEIPGEWYHGDIDALCARLLCRLTDIRRLIERERHEKGRAVGVIEFHNLYNSGS
jgi:hypothetical protein